MTIEELCNSFSTLVTNNDKRQERAQKDRERLRAQAAAGEVPTGHRVEWIKETAIEMVKTLGEQCKIFDQKYQGDRATGDDCLSAAMTLVNLVLSHGGKRLEAIPNGFKIVSDN
jgi:hypothetical protein